MSIQKKRGRGRPKGSTNKKVSTQPQYVFDASKLEIKTGGDLSFDSKIFDPIKTNRELDIILSTDGGLMPATNMILTGGPGSGKTTLVLDMLSDFTTTGKKCLFVSGEMDDIGYYKYCQRIPKFQNVPVLFLKEHAGDVKEVIEHVFNQGWDVIAIDSIAEILEMYKDAMKCTMTAAENWLLSLQDRIKKGHNEGKYYTSIINIQQVTKSGDFVGSNRLKHMVDAMFEITTDKERTFRAISFSKNRDGDKEFKIFFSFYGGEVSYSFETVYED